MEFKVPQYAMVPESEKGKVVEMEVPCCGGSLTLPDPGLSLTFSASGIKPKVIQSVRSKNRSCIYFSKHMHECCLARFKKKI